MIEKKEFDKGIDRRGTYCTQWDYIEDRFGKSDLLPFTISDMDFQAPKEIINAISNRNNHGIYGYSRWNHLDYKNSIVSWYNNQFKYDLNPEYIQYSPTVIYSISKFIEMFSKEGDGIIVQTPTYDAFYKLIKETNRNILENELVCTEGNYTIDFIDFENKIKNAKIFLLCSPHNPTGRVWKRWELQKLIKICEENNVFIISDEIHMDICYSENKHIPIIAVDPNYRDKMVICTSASKTFNIPSLGGAYNLIPDIEIKEKFASILKNRDGLSSPTIFGVVATITAYNNCEAWLIKLKDYLHKNLEYAKNYIDNNMPLLKTSIPEGTYFLWIDFSKLNLSPEEFQKKLINYGKVAIMPGIVYGEGGKNYIRLNVACSRKKLEKGIEGINRALNYVE